jgi:hypothetical protein
MLQEDDRIAIADLVYDYLYEAVLPEPELKETEPAYTARIVQPVLNALIKKIDVPGLVVGGHGMGPAHSVYFMGLEFIPDAEITYRGDKMLAIENKFIGSLHRQRQITGAVGQAMIYALGGYEYSIGLLLDTQTSSYIPYQGNGLDFRSNLTRFVIKRRNHIGQFISEQ